MQARRTAGPPFARLGGALGLSLLAHAGLLAALLCAMQGGASRSVGRHKGSMQVTLVAAHPAPKTAAPARPATPSPPPHAPRPVTQALPGPAQPDTIANKTASARPPSKPALSDMQESRVTASPDQPAAKTAQAEAGLATATTAAMATATPPASDIDAPRPGASFANLFTPVIVRPMGRGRWRGNAERAPQPSAEMLREQALMGLRQTLSDRAMRTQAALQETPLLGACDIKLDLSKRIAEVRCSDPGDAARLWGMLDQIAAPGAVSDAAMPTCMAADARQIQWRPCGQLALFTPGPPEPP